MEPQKESTRPIIDQLKEYVETRLKLLKYEGIDRSSAVIAGIVIDLSIIICLLLTFLFASLTLALFLSDCFGSYWQGFGSVSLIYLLIAFAVYLSRHVFKRPVINIIIRKLFN
ncbi:phage holin family protein [Mucilaginibacter segetis]|uniref:Phage holin family protein n=1 Tax=Mucilaginibacter segetis TaxID=2793071 RepID=A0A934PVK7_9SPHI|nr:phage holin family protein [Mucilaginibacter segetis]MBK0380220.1 phage holin family protein [Mucilaginibacter segetis]